MPLSKRKRQKLLTLCGQLNEDDAVDPRDFFRKRYRSNNASAQRLCRQVSDTISLILSGECSDETLQSLEIFSVQPAPDSKRLLVIVRPHPDMATTITPLQVLEKLEAVKPLLRREITTAICRRKTPSLVFEVLWPCAHSQP